MRQRIVFAFIFLAFAARAGVAAPAPNASVREKALGEFVDRRPIDQKGPVDPAVLRAAEAQARLPLESDKAYTSRLEAAARGLGVNATLIPAVVARYLAAAPFGGPREPNFLDAAANRREAAAFRLEAEAAARARGVARGPQWGSGPGAPSAPGAATAGPAGANRRAAAELAALNRVPGAQLAQGFTRATAQPPAPPRPQARPAAARAAAPSFWESLAAGYAPAPQVTPAEYRAEARRLRAVADANTHDSTNGSASGWFTHYSAAAASAYLSAQAFFSDGAAEVRALKSAPHAVANMVRAAIADSSPEAKAGRVRALDDAGRSFRKAPSWSAAFNVERAAMKQAGDGVPGGGVVAGLLQDVIEDTVKAGKGVRTWYKTKDAWNALEATTGVGKVAMEVGVPGVGGAALKGGSRAVAVGEEAVEAAATAEKTFESVEAAGRFGPVKPRPMLQEAGLRPDIAQALEVHYQRTEELEKQFKARKLAGASRAELDAIREESWEQYRQASKLQTQMPELKKFFETATPGTPGSPEFMRVVATNMGTQLETVGGVRLAGYRSLERDLKKGGIMPNANKVAEEGTLSGSGTHLLRDGSEHMVSIAERLQGGLVLLMTGYADAERVKKTEEGIMYGFEGVQNAARLPPTRQVFFDALGQGELMVPSVPVDRIKTVRAWRSHLNPANPKQIVFEYSEPIPLSPTANPAEIEKTLRSLPTRNQMRVEIPADGSRFTYKTDL